MEAIALLDLKLKTSTRFTSNTQNVMKVPINGKFCLSKGCQQIGNDKTSITMTKLNIKNYKVITKISTLFIVTLVKTKA